ncbi:MAG: hypothetical protein SPC78_00190 [Candidatus Faecousia sp.]|nr:hypothetical protein [Candidatus Faecousia sp.]
MNDSTAVCIDSVEVKNVNQRRQLSWCLSAFGLLILILDGKTAFHGAMSGIELCLKTVIPALFPFLVLSAVLLNSTPLSSHLEKAVSSLFGLPEGTGSLLLPCFLGGYPVGAQSVYQAYAGGQLQKQEAERLLAFCNNAGPAFLFGMIGQVFTKSWMPWVLWGIHVAGAWAAARCVPCIGTSARFDGRPVKSRSDIMRGAVSTMGIICGWIVLFRVLIAFLDRWILWLLPQTARVAFIGLLELSNGCCELAQIRNISTRFILCSVFLAAGGLCVTAQTISVTPGLSLRYYFFGKAIQILVSLILSSGIMYRSPMPLLLLLPPLFYQYSKKRSRNHALTGV